MNKIFIILFFLTSTSLFAEDTLVGKKFICSKLFWGFDFFSSNKVNVISTDINNITSVKEYYYEIDLDLKFINLYLIESNKKEFIFSIEQNSLRVDIWTMTSGGNTVREMIPEGFCSLVFPNNLLTFIEDLKNK